jgi:hypothetical protein
MTERRTLFQEIWGAHMVAQEPGSPAVLSRGRPPRAARALDREQNEMAQFTTLRSRAVLLSANDIDTGQIISARFLKVTDKDGLGKSLFADWPYTADGSPRPELDGVDELGYLLRFESQIAEFEWRPGRAAS